MFKLILFISVVIGTTWSYDFSDTEFNKVLLDDLIEYDALTEEELPALKFFDRHRRDVETPPPPPPPKCRPPGEPHKGPPGHKGCCNDNFEHPPEMKEFKKQCFSEVKKARKAKHLDGDFDVFSCEKMERAKEKIICAMECVARKQGLIDEKGNSDEKKIREHMKTQHKEGSWKLKVDDEVIDTCMAEVATKTKLWSAKNVTSEENSIEKCNPSASIFTHCLWREYTMKCPVDLQDQSPHCKRARERFTKKKESSKPAEGESTPEATPPPIVKPRSPVTE